MIDSKIRTLSVWPKPGWLGAFWTLCALGILATSVSEARAIEPSWNDYLDHAYVYSSAETEDLQALLTRTSHAVGRTLADYLAETFPADTDRAQPRSEIQIRRKAIAELLMVRTNQPGANIESAVTTIDALSDRLDRHENRYWYHTIHAHQALQTGDAESFVDQVLSLWLEVISPLETPFETYKTLALTQNGNSGFVRTLPHLYESVSRLILVQSQRAALDADIDSLGAIVRVLSDDRVGADPEAIPVDASSKDYLDHIVARLDGPESDGGSLSFTLALVGAERAHHLARTRLAEEGFAFETKTAIRDSVSAYQRALRNANTLQGQVAVYTRALRQLGEVYAAGERLEVATGVEIPFSIERAFSLYETLQSHKDGAWARDGYVDQGREAYLSAMTDLWSEIQEASFNAASYYMSRRDAVGDVDDETIVHAINHYSRYLHAFDRYASDPSGESLPDAAWFGAYAAARGIGDGVLFFAGGDASVEQLDEAIAQYDRALGYFPFDRALWSTLAVALQRSGRESDFLAVAKPVAERVVHSRHLDRWIQNKAAWSTPLESFRQAFSNDLSLVYFGFADEGRLDELETEFARLRDEREDLTVTIAATRSERDELNAQRREAHQRATELSGETEVAAPPSVTGQPRSPESQDIARLSLDLERLSGSSARLEARVDAISQSLPIFKATLGHEALGWELATQRDHPVHTLLRRVATEVAPPANDSNNLTHSGTSEQTWQVLESWIGGISQ